MDTDTLKSLHKLSYHGEVKAVAFSPDSEVLASVSGSFKETVMLWNTKTRVMLHTFKVGAYIRSLSYSDNGTILDTDKGALPTVPFHHLESTSRQIFAHKPFVISQWIIIGNEKLFGFLLNIDHSARLFMGALLPLYISLVV